MNEFTSILEKHFRSWDDFVTFKKWVQSVGAVLLDQAAAMESYRKVSAARPAVRRGTQRWIPDTCLRESLARYFRDQGWPVSQTQAGLFVQVASVVLGRVSLNQNLLRRLAQDRSRPT